MVAPHIGAAIQAAASGGVSAVTETRAAAPTPLRLVAS
jgi:hypothetical protein